MSEQTTPETPSKAVTSLNPCSYDKIGNALAWLTEGTDCRCCIGARIVGAFAFGLILAAALTIAFLR